MRTSFVKCLHSLFVVWWSSALLTYLQVEKLFDVVVDSDVKQVAQVLPKCY